MTSLAGATSLILSPEKGLSLEKDASAREQLAAAAKQFEAIFVRQMLAAARKTSFDDTGIFSSQAMQTFRQMQDERFAEMAAQTGSLGLATVIEAQLARYLPAEPDAVESDTSATSPTKGS